MLLESFDLPACTVSRARTDRRKRAWWLSGAARRADGPGVGPADRLCPRNAQGNAAPSAG